MQNYAYSLKGFENDLGQSAIRRAESWGIPVHIGILAGFGGRTTPMTKLHRKLQLAHQRGFGAVYFYWGSHSFDRALPSRSSRSLVGLQFHCARGL